MLAVGCATVGDRPALDDAAAVWQARQARLTPLKSWNIQGRLSARTPTEGWHASLRWVRNDQRHHIDLWGPLGRGHLRLTQDRYGARLRDADHNTYWAESGQQLLFDTTGWWLPLDGLNYWVLGLPVPETPAEHALDQQGRLKSLNQLGWQINFLRYRRHGAYEFPSKLFIRRRLGNPGTVAFDDETLNEPILEVRLVIERWTITP